MSLTTDRLYVFTMFQGPDDSIWNQLLKILSLSDYFEAHLLIQYNSDWIDYAEAFPHLVRRFSEGVEYIAYDLSMKRIGKIIYPYATPKKVKVLLPIWKTVGPAMARSAQLKVHGSPLVMSLDILIRGEDTPLIFHAMNGMIITWTSEWDYGYFIPVFRPDEERVKDLRERGVKADMKSLERIYYGVWRRFLFRGFSIGLKTWERLSTLQGILLDFYHPLPMTVDEIQAFLKLPNDPSLPIRYRREKRVDVYIASWRRWRDSRGA